MAHLLHGEDHLGLEVRVAHVEAPHVVGLHVHVPITHQLSHLSRHQDTQSVEEISRLTILSNSSWTTGIQAPPLQWCVSLALTCRALVP